MKGYIDAIVKILELKAGINADKAILLQGDASHRRFLRVYEKTLTWIIMDTQNEIDLETDPFLLVQTYLDKHQIPVPSIEKIIEKHGIIIMEDLGDITLQNSYLTDPDHTLANYYPKVIEILYKMQRVCKDPGNGSCPAFHLCFDAKKLYQELIFFEKHFIEGYLEQAVSSVIRTKLRSCFKHISLFLSEFPFVFTHRDYHSRNIMIKDHQPYLIDFQDARLGIPEYDLSSLLRDAYVSLPEPFIENTQRMFQNQLGGYEKRRHIFSMMCLQRNLKALGTFGYQATRCQNNVYIQYIPNLLNHIATELNYLSNSFSRKLSSVLHNLIQDMP